MVGCVQKWLVLTALLVVFIVALPPPTYADIHKCTDEYGNVAYLQLPCPVQVAEAAEAGNDPDGADDEIEQQLDQTESSPAPQAAAPPFPSSRRPGELLEDCKKRYRDQIDEIDAEMRIAFSSEQGEMYKEKLLALTQQLRRCG